MPVKVGRSRGERGSDQKQAFQYARSLIEASLDPLVTISPDGKITDVNEATIKVTGVPREKLIGTDFSNYFTKPERARAGYQQVFAKGFVTDYPLTIHHKDGRLTDVLYNASVYKDVSGNVLGVFAAARAHAQMEMHPGAKEIHYEAVVASSIDAIVTSDSAGRIVGWNRSAERLFGYAEAEIIGQPVTALIPPRFHERHLSGMERAQSAGERLTLGRTIEGVGRRKDTSEFPLELSPTAWRSGESRYFTAALRDITQRKAAEATIERHVNLYAALSKCNKAIVRCATQEELFQRICTIAVRYGGMRAAWVRLIDNETHVARLVAEFSGFRERMKSLSISTDTLDPSKQGPTVIAIRENRPVWVQEIRQDPANAPWQEHAAHSGIGALAALPIHCKGIVVGAFVLGSGEANSFDEQARDLLVEMATDIGFALDNFDRDSRRRLMEENLRAAEDKYRGLVEQAIAGIFVMQDGKVVYANRRCAEIVGHGSVDELIGTDPLRWVVEADRGKVAENMRRLLDGEAQSVAMDFGALNRDGGAIQIGTHVARSTHEGQPAIIGLLQDISEKKRAEEEIRRYVEQLKIAFMSTVEVATTLSEMRDPYTAGHERRVAEIAVAIGAELGFDVHRQEGLRVAGYLHDIGKITIPLDILAKPGKLSPIEFQLIQGHARSSYDALKGVAFPWPVAQVALQHHERMDGSGYPQNLKGEAILLEARIMAVSDVVEAMSSHRPYRPGLGIEKALAEIERGSGTVYDSAVAGACLILFRQKGYQLPSYRHA